MREVSLISQLSPHPEKLLFAQAAGVCVGVCAYNPDPTCLWNILFFFLLWLLGSTVSKFQPIFNSSTHPLGVCSALGAGQSSWDTGGDQEALVNAVTQGH